MCEAESNKGAQHENKVPNLDGGRITRGRIDA
jgi:hypothetical protein